MKMFNHEEHEEREGIEKENEEIFSSEPLRDLRGKSISENDLRALRGKNKQ